MKKLILAIFAVCLALGVSAQTPEKKAKGSTDMENIRVGKTLSPEQKTELTALFLKFHSTEFATPQDRSRANSEVEAKLKTIYTPEQVKARSDYFKEMAARRAAGQ